MRGVLQRGFGILVQLPNLFNARKMAQVNNFGGFVGFAPRLDPQILMLGFYEISLLMKPSRHQKKP